MEDLNTIKDFTVSVTLSVDRKMSIKDIAKLQAELYKKVGKDIISHKEKITLADVSKIFSELASPQEGILLNVHSFEGGIGLEIKLF